MYVFISHSSNEANIAEELCGVIEAGGHRCFIAPRDIKLGKEYAEEIVNAIDHANAVLLVLSKASNQSLHVLREVERAVTKSIPVLVYKVEEVELTKSMEYFLMTHQWMEAGRNSYEDVVSSINNIKGAGEKKVASAPAKGKRKLGTPRMVAVFVAMFVLLTGGITVSKNMGNNNEAVLSEAVKPGDTLMMGSYNGEDIYWRVLKVSEDGTEAVVIARDVLTVKAYDAAESGRYNHDGTNSYYFSGDEAKLDAETAAYVKGNSSWENSNIRTWLNSASENVKYEGQAPVSAAMADGSNGYSGEKGFLCSFTEEELAIIKTTTVETAGNVLEDRDKVVTEDKVFLLSMDELVWLEEANVSLLAVPTLGAIEKNETYWYQDYCLGYGVDTIMWWLREPVEDSASMCYLVGNGYREENIYTWEVGVESFGIRPAMTIDMTTGRGYAIIP